MKGTNKNIYSLKRKFTGWHLLVLFTFSLLIFTVESCDTTVPQAFIGDDVITISKYIENNPENYSKFWELMVSTNMEITLSAYNPDDPGNNGGYTLFLPTNAAFDQYISDSEKYSSFTELLNDKDFANLLVRYHLINAKIESNDFPFGDLPDTTVTGDLLTIEFDDSKDTTVYLINSTAPVIRTNIELTNGYIHVLGSVLNPIAFSSYNYLSGKEDFSIFTEALRITGLKDTLGIYRTNSKGKIVKNRYTLLAEPDSVYAKQGIYSIDDLINKYQAQGTDVSNFESDFYQYTAYHIMEGSFFIDDFDGTENFNTYANFPIQIDAQFDIKINEGLDTLDIVIEGQDTTYINYVRILLNKSNILTKNGAIHVLQDHMEVVTPRVTSKSFQFNEEDIIDIYKKTPGEYYLYPEDMEFLKWEGTENVKYVKSDDNIPAGNNDYIEIQDNFSIEYTIPKLLPGKYEVRIKAESKNSENATIQVYVDGKRMGSSFDLTSGGNPYDTFKVGTVNFLLFETHVVKINALLPGKFIWDLVQFKPI
ncbi:fasciclin domain-containing protein [Bacteroidota bacterium]